MTNAPQVRSSSEDDEGPVSTQPMPPNAQEDEDDEEIMEMRRQRDKLEDSSLATSRSALSRLRETEAVGQTTVKQLKSQGDQLKNAEGTAKEAKAYADQSHKLSKDIERHDHFLAFKWTNPFNRKKKRMEKEYQKKQAEIESRASGLHYADDERKRGEEEEETPEEEEDKENSKKSGKGKKKAPVAPPKAYLTKEEEYQDNLDEISSGVQNLKGMSLEMNEELNEQDVTLDSLGNTVDSTNKSLEHSNKIIKKFAK